MSWEEMSSHGGDIYRLAIEAELTGWGFYQEGSLWYPPPTPPLEGYGYGKAPSDIVNEVHAKHGDLLNDFGDFQQMPDPAGFSEPIGQMTQVLAELSVGSFIDPVTEEPVPGNGSSQDIANIRAETERWHGEAAQSFTSNFLNGLDPKSGGQWSIAWTLLQSLRAERSIWERARKDVDQVAHDTIDVLKGDAELPSTDKDSTEVFNALLGVGSVIPGLSTGISIFTAAVGVVGVLDSHGTGEALPRSPEAVAGIVTTMRESLSTINTTIREREEDLQTSLQEVLTHLQNRDNQELYFVLPTPTLATPGNSQDRFGGYY